MKPEKPNATPMAWNEPGGNGSKDPWGNKSKNQGPPDLDEIFKNVQNKFGKLFGGGGRGGSSSGITGPGGLGASVIGVIALFIWAATGLYTVDEGERGVILRFGAYSETVTSGLHWHLPFPIEKRIKVNVDNVRLTNHKASMLTQDENIVDVELAVQYKLGDAKDYLFNVRTPDATLTHATESAVRQSIGGSTMDFVMREGRSQISAQVKNDIQQMLDFYVTGIIITDVNMQLARPPAPVKDAFDDVIQAREDKERLINEGEAYRNEVLPTARGMAARMREEADGYKQEVIAKAEGESTRFKKLLKEYKKAPQVTRERLYIDAMETVLSNSSKVMIDVKSGNSLMYLPLDKLMGAAGMETSRNLQNTSQQLRNSNTAAPRNRRNLRNREAR